MFFSSLDLVRKEPYKQLKGQPLIPIGDELGDIESENVEEKEASGLLANLSFGKPAEPQR